MSATQPDIVSVVIPCYRDAPRAIALLGVLSLQHVPPSWSLETIVVDDGSGDDTAQLLLDALPDYARVLSLPTNQGRSVARQAGANAANGRVLVFLDADCEPRDPSFLAKHLAALQGGAAASTGPIEGTGQGFWHRYQIAVSARRAAAHRRGEPGVGTTANLAVDAAAFLACGGFSRNFTRYGFEDTHLLLRLGRHGHIEWSDAPVRHMDELSMASVARRMREAGRYGAGPMHAKHPEFYRHSRFGRCDAALNPWLRPVGLLARYTLAPAIRGTDAALRSGWLPWTVSRHVVSALSGLSFLVGTCEAQGQAE